MPASFKFHLHVLSALLFFVCIAIIPIASDVCKEEVVNGIVTCQSVWSVGANVALTGNIDCNTTECRTGLYEESAMGGKLGNTIALLDNRRCNNTRNVTIGEVTYFIVCLLMPGNASFRVNVQLNSQIVTDVEINVYLLNPTRRHIMDVIAQVKNCVNETNSDVVVSASTTLARFKDPGTFHCAQHSGQVFYNNRTPAHLTYCNEHAQWEDLDKVHCHYSPTVSFVHQILSNGSEFQVLNLCKVSDGYPMESNTSLTVVNQDGTTTVIKNGTIITPEHHGLNASCFVANNFGNDMDNFALNITFGPLDFGSTFTCQLVDFEESNRYSVVIHLTFAANPPQGELKLSGLDAGVSCELKEVLVMCTVLLNNVTSDDIVTVIYERRVLGNSTLGVWNILEQCFGNDHLTTDTTALSTLEMTLRPSESFIDFETQVPVAEIAALATIGGVLLVASVIVAITVITRIRGKT